MSPEGRERVSSVCAECGAPVSFELGAMQVRCEHCEAGLVVEQGQRLVMLNCPRCAGNFYYLDGAMCGRCPYCEAALLAVSHDRLLRYVVRPAAGAPQGAEGAELRLLPFWHLAGMLYGWDVGARVVLEDARDAHAASSNEAQSGEPMPVTIRKDSGPIKAFRGRVVDVTLPDPSASALGITTLHHRAAVFPLEPFAAEHEDLARRVPPALSAADARAMLYRRAVNLGAPTEGMTRLDCQRVDLVTEELALYYYPFWVRGRGAEAELWDGVTGAPERLGSPAPAPEAEGVGAFDDLKVLELLCERCGATLPPGNHSRVIPCVECGAFWRVERDGLVPFEATFARPPGDEQAGDPVWLPFWFVPVTLRYAGKRARRVLDLRNVLGVLPPPATLPTRAPGDALGYFVPAYGAPTMPRVDHAARDMTRLQPLLRPLRGSDEEQGHPDRSPRPRGEVYHCFYGPKDAEALAYVTWILILPGTVPHRLRSLRVQTGEAALWYVPFEDRGRELRNLLTGLRYDRSAFRGVKH